MFLCVVKVDLKHLPWLAGEAVQTARSLVGSTMAVLWVKHVSVSHSYWLAAKLHQPPCSGSTRGGVPATLPDTGPWWSASDLLGEGERRRRGSCQ